MTTQTFKLDGSVALSPTIGTTSGIPGVAIPLLESLQLAQFAQQAFVLDADPAQSVSLGTMTEANVLVVFANGKVRVRVTSTDGSTQAIPVDGLLILIAQSVGLTAVDLTRVSGTETEVNVLLGQML